MKKKTFLLLPALALVFSLAACTGNTPTPTPEGEGGEGGEVDPPVTEVTLSSIALSGNYQTEFEFDEPFSYSGLIVTATYSDATSKAVTGYQVSSPDMSTAGTKDVTVSYTEKEVTKTASYQITVKEQETPPSLATLVSISLSGTYKTEFNVGDAFTYEGLVVTASYSDNTSHEVTTFNVEAPDMTSAGTKAVEVSYTEDQITKTASYNVTLTEKVETYDYYVEFGGEQIGAEKQTYALLENQVAEYAVSLGAVTKDAEVSILNADKVALTDNFGADPDSTNNVTGNANPFKIHNDAVDAKVYIKVWESGWVNFYVTGYEAGEDPVTGETTKLYCKMAYEWWTVDSAAIGAYYWGGSSITEWPGVRGTALSEDPTVWEFDIPSDSTGLIFTRVSGSDPVTDYGAKTGNLTIPTDGKNLYTITSSEAVWGDPGVSGVWSVYGEDPVTPVDPETPDVPTEQGYYICGLEDWTYATATKMENVVGENVAEFKNLQAEADEEIRVRSYYTDRDPADQWASVGNGEETFGAPSGDNFKFSKDGAYDVYAKYENDVFKFYVAEHVETPIDPEPPVDDDIPAEEGFYVVSNNTNWKFAGATKMVMPGSENGDLAELKGYEAKAGEEFKIRSYLAGEKVWYNLEDSTDNYVVGDVDRVLDIYVNASGVVYVFDHDGGDPLPPEPPVEVSYKIVGSMNSWDYETSTLGFTDYNVEEEIQDGQYVSQLKGLFPVTTEESFKVSDGTNWYGVSATEAGYQYAHDDSGAFSTDVDGNIVVSGEGTVTVFFKTFESGAHGMYVAFEGTAAPITPATNATFEITGVPSWYPNDGAKVFVWAWGGDLGAGAWIQCELTENETDCTLSFEAPGNITGFLVARCHADTVTPDWSVTGNEAGKVYNQSKDVTVSEGVTSYVFEAA